MKAQIGVEYIFLFAVVLSAMIPITIYFLDISESSMKTSKSIETLNSVASAADNLYYLGGGKTTLFLEFPEDIVSYYVGNRTLILTIEIYGETGDAVATTVTNITGDLTTVKGTHTVTLEYVNKSIVLISTD